MLTTGAALSPKVLPNAAEKAVRGANDTTVSATRAFCATSATSRAGTRTGCPQGAVTVDEAGIGLPHDKHRAVVALICVVRTDTELSVPDE